MDSCLGVYSLYPEKWEETKAIALGEGNPGTPGRAAEREEKSFACTFRTDGAEGQK